MRRQSDRMHNVVYMPHIAVAFCAHIQFTHTCSQLEEQLQQLEQTKAQLVTSQYENHEAQEQWSLERSKMLTELELTKRQYVEEKGRITDIIAEVTS